MIDTHHGCQGVEGRRGLDTLEERWNLSIVVRTLNSDRILNISQERLNETGSGAV